MKGKKVRSYTCNDDKHDFDIIEEKSDGKNKVLTKKCCRCKLLISELENI